MLLQWWYFIFLTFFPRYLCFSGGHKFTAYAQYLTWPDAIWVQSTERNLCGTPNRTNVDTCNPEDFNPNRCSRNCKCSHFKGLTNKSLEQTGLCPPKHQRLHARQFAVTICPLLTPLWANKIYKMISPFCNSHRGFAFHTTLKAMVFRPRSTITQLISSTQPNRGNYKLSVSLMD